MIQLSRVLDYLCIGRFPTTPQGAPISTGWCLLRHVATRTTMAELSALTACMTVRYVPVGSWRVAPWSESAVEVL